MQHLVDPSTKTLKLVLPGDILSTDIETLRPAIFGILESTPVENWQTLVFDLSATAMIDSAGLNLLISVIRSVQPRGVKLRRPLSAGSGSDSYAQLTSLRANSLP